MSAIDPGQLQDASLDTSSGTGMLRFWLLSVVKFYRSLYVARTFCKAVVLLGATLRAPLFTVVVQQRTGLSRVPLLQILYKLFL